MKTFVQKALPWALPILVLVFVLSGCGKDAKIHALDPSAQQVATKAAQKNTQAQRANGAISGSDGRLNPDDFSAKCLTLQGRIESGGTICASPVALQLSTMNAGETDVEQVISASLPTGYLIISSGDAPPTTADMLLKGVHFMSANERKLSIPGRLSFYATSKSTNSLSVSVWKCSSNKLVGDTLEDVWCNENILQGHQ
jgi:hypothetical protein